MNLPIIVLGAGGHAKVVIEALQRSGSPLLGVVEVDPARKGEHVLGVEILGDDEVVLAYRPDQVLLANGLGSVGIPQRRREIFNRFSARGYRFASVVHPAAVVAADVEVGEGTQIMAGAIVQPGCRLGVNSIVNTRASVDHDCRIGDHAHIAPGVTLSGDVVVGETSHLGTGVTVIQGMTIGSLVLVAAGAVVVDDVVDGATVKGIPARVVMK